MPIDKAAPRQLEGTNTWETLRNLRQGDHFDRDAMRGAFMRLLRGQRVPEALWVLKALHQGPRPAHDAPLPFADLPTSRVLSDEPLRSWPLPSPTAIRDEAPLLEYDCGGSVEALFAEFTHEHEITLNTVLYPSHMLTHLGTQSDKGRALAQARRELGAVLINVGEREQCVSTGHPDGVSFYRVKQDRGDVLRVRVDCLQGHKLQHAGARGVGFAPTVDIPWPMLSTPEGATAMRQLLEILLPSKDWRKQSFTEGSAAEVSRWVSHVRHILRSDPTWASWPMADSATVSYAWLRWDPPASDAVMDYFHYMRRNTQLGEFLRRQGASDVDVKVVQGWNETPDSEGDFWRDLQAHPDQVRVNAFVSLLGDGAPMMRSEPALPRTTIAPAPTSLPTKSTAPGPQLLRSVTAPHREDAVSPLHQLIWEQGAKPLTDWQAWEPHLTAEAIGTRDAQGNTPLHLACALQNTSVADLLLAHGASFQTANRFGHLPTDDMQFNAFWRHMTATHGRALNVPNQEFLRANTPAYWEGVLRAVDASLPMPDQVRAALTTGMGLSAARLDDLNTRGHLMRTVGHIVGLTGSVEGFRLEGDNLAARVLTRMETLCAMLLDTRPLPAPLTRTLLLQQLAMLHQGPMLSMYFFPHGDAPEDAPAAAPTQETIAKPAEADAHARRLYQPVAKTVCHQVQSLTPGNTAVLAGIATERGWGESSHAVYLAAHILPETPQRLTVACYNLGGGTCATNPVRATRLTPGTWSVPTDVVHTPAGRRALEQFVIALWMLNQRPEQDGTGLVYHAMGEFLERLERERPGCAKFDVLRAFTRREQRAGNCSLAGLDYMLQGQLAVALGGNKAFARVKRAYRVIKERELAMAQERLEGRLNTPLVLHQRRVQQRLAYLRALQQRDAAAAKRFVAKHRELAPALTPQERKELKCRTWAETLADRDNQRWAGSVAAYIALGAAGSYFVNEACRLGVEALMRTWAPATAY